MLYNKIDDNKERLDKQINDLYVKKYTVRLLKRV